MTDPNSSNELGDFVASGGARTSGLVEAIEARAVRDGTAWSHVAELVADMRRVVEDADIDEDLRAEGWRYLLRYLNAGIRICIEHDDPDHPSFGRLIENRASWGLDNPDCNYSWAPVRGDAVYRISGRLGTATAIEFQVNTGHFGDGNVGGWHSSGSLSRDQLDADPDGSVEIVVGGEPGPLNHLPTDEDAGFLVVRQYFNDWGGEEPARLHIERADGPVAAPEATDAWMATRLTRLAQWLTSGLDSWQRMADAIAGLEVGDITPFPVPDDAAGLTGQAYGMGRFTCSPDEAVIITFEPPAARMWSLSLADRFWQSLEFGTRQSSINSHQATLTDDGRFVGVLCHDDPGVANWLDPVGCTDGTLAIRYLLADGSPTVALCTVPRQRLDDELPADTPRLTADERDAILRARAADLSHRYGY
ncbi:MAG: DUF1214 domain-containing protein [Nitriliruptorales bacterium]|nr:DUF1214 domain-containing protein [Nitriliruptorales bacterium]